MSRWTFRTWAPCAAMSAWGGNWFLPGRRRRPAPLTLQNEPELTRTAQRIKAALTQQNITGADGAEIDHIELFGAPVAAGANSRNFVLCPGDAYDRSPCGTGTSAKLACLAARGALAPGEPWVQGERHRQAASRPAIGALPVAASFPRITGEAFVCAEATLVRHADDPFRDGIG